MTATASGYEWPAVGYTQGWRQAIEDLADSAEDIITTTRAIQTYRPADSSALAALAGMAAGDYAYQVDTAVLYAYSGSAWVAVIVPAAARIVPTASSGSIDSSSGRVTFTSASSVTIDGVFSSSYSRYKVTWCVALSAAASVTVQLRASGSTNTSAVYDRQVLQGVNATAAAAQATAATSWSFAAGAIGTSDGTLMLSNPADSSLATSGTVVHGATPNPLTTTAGIYNTLVLHRTSAAFDGVNFAASTGNMTGWIRVSGE